VEKGVDPHIRSAVESEVQQQHLSAAGVEAYLSGRLSEHDHLSVLFGDPEVRSYGFLRQLDGSFTSDDHAQKKI
jgi:hypothetical protein